MLNTLKRDICEMLGLRDVFTGLELVEIIDNMVDRFREIQNELKYQILLAAIQETIDELKRCQEEATTEAEVNAAISELDKFFDEVNAVPTPADDSYVSHGDIPSDGIPIHVN